MIEIERAKMDILREVGLTEGESKVYNLLLTIGSLNASRISRETKLNRSNVYRILERLADKKLVFSSIIDKTKIFNITRVERLNELHKEKIDSLKNLQDKINKFISESSNAAKLKMPESQFAVEIYEGIKQIRNTIENVLHLKTNDIVYSIGKEGVLANYSGAIYWLDNLKNKRVKKGIKFKALYNFHKDSKPARTKLTEIRYADLTGIGDTEISFYNNTLLIYVMTKENPRVILIKNKDIFNSMVSYFNLLWEKSKKM